MATPTDTRPPEAPSRFLPLFVGFWMAVGYPSLAIFKKLGPAPLLGWTLLVTVGLWFFARYVGPWMLDRLTVRSAWAGLAAMTGLLLVAYLLIHPVIDTAGFQLVGRQFGAADADDAIDLAISELLAGRFPYRATTFLGYPITPLPGSLLLAAPFYFLGDSGLQNVFWFGLFFVALGRVTGRPALAAVLAVATLLACPTVPYQLLQGIDYLTNAIQVLVGAAWLLETEKRAGPRWERLCASLLLGLSLSSRLNFLLVVPLLFLALSQSKGTGAAVRALVPSGLVFVAVTLPLYLWDPAGFSPLHTSNKLNMDGRTPWAPLVVPLLGLALTLWLGSQRGADERQAWLRNAFVVQAFLVLSGFVVASVSTGALQLSFVHFGVLALPFGLAAFGPALLDVSRVRA